MAHNEEGALWSRHPTKEFNDVLPASPTLTQELWSSIVQHQEAGKE